MSEAPKPEEISSLANKTEIEVKSIDERVTEKERKEIKDEGLRQIEIVWGNISLIMEDLEGDFSKFQYSIEEAFSKANPEKFYSEEYISQEATMDLYKGFSEKFSKEVIEKVSPIGHIKLDIKEFKTVFSQKFEQHVEKDHGGLEEVRSGGTLLFGEMMHKMQEELTNPLIAYIASMSKELRDSDFYFKKKLSERERKAESVMYGLDKSRKMYNTSYINQFAVEVRSFSKKLDTSLDALNKSAEGTIKDINIEINKIGEKALLPLSHAYASKQREIDGV